MNDDFLKGIAERVGQPDEGATIDVKNSKEVDSGWAAARAGYEHVEPRQTFSADSLSRYADQNRSAIQQAGHMGLWHPPRVYGGRPKGIYHDVVDVQPDTYEGGLKSMVQGYANQQDSVFNIDRFDEMDMVPKTRKQRTRTRSAIRNLAAQRPGGQEPDIADQPTSQLGASLRNRQPAQAPSDIYMRRDPLYEEAQRVGAVMRTRQKSQ